MDREGSSENSCEPEEFKNIVSMLRFFAQTGRFNILDRIGFAQNPEAVEVSIYEAIRTIRALERRAEKLKLLLNGEVREYECLEHEKLESPTAYCGGVKGTLAEARGDLGRGSLVCCYPKPLMPDEGELERFFKALHGLGECDVGGLDLAKQLVALALSYPRPRRGGGGK